MFRSNRQAARQRAETSYALCQRAASAVTPDALMSGSQYSGGAALDSDNRQRAADSREQLNHYSGEVYTSLRPIVERLAGRPIRLARVAKRGRRKKPGKALKAHVHEWFTKSSLLAGGAEPQDVTIIDQHPVLDAIHDPAPSICGWTNWHLKSVSIASLKLTGFAYWWFPVVDGRTELWYLPPDWVWPINTKEKLNVGWKIKPPHSDGYEVDRDEIAPFWYPNPKSPLQGLGPLEAGAKGVLIAEFLEECQKRHFQLGPHPTAVVTLGGQSTKEGKNIRPRLKQWQLNQIRDAFDMRYANVFNAGRTVVLDNLIDKFEPWSNTPHTMSYGENAETARKRVRQVFGTNDYAVGEGSLGSRAESAESDYHFVENTLNPTCELFSRVLTVCVLPVFDEADDLILFLEPCEPHDSEQKAADYKFAAGNGIINIGEFRVHRLGMEPGPHGANFLVPNTFSIRTPDEMVAGIKPPTPAAPGGALPAPGQPSAPSEPTEPSETPEDDEAVVAEGEDPDKSTRIVKKNFDDGWRKQYVETWLKTHGDREKSLELAMLSLQKEQAAAVVEALGQYDANSLKSTTPADVAKSIFDPQAWVARLKEAAREPLLYAWLSGASHEMLAYRQTDHALPTPPDAAENQKDADLGYDFGVDLPDNVLTGISKGLEKALAQPYWAWIEETKQNDLIAFLEQAYHDGEPLTEIVKHVSSIFDGEIGQDRALCIARTETTNGLNAGQLEAQKHLEDEGVLDGKTWIDTADSRTRADHLSAGGQTVGVREKFVVGGHECDHPGDSSLPARQRVNCRCTQSGSTGFENRSAAWLTKCPVHDEGKSFTGWPYRGLPNWLGLR